MPHAGVESMSIGQSTGVSSVGQVERPAVERPSVVRLSSSNSASSGYGPCAPECNTGDQWPHRSAVSR